MDGRELVTRFYSDEGAPGARVALRYATRDDTGTDRMEFNVWLLTVYVGRGTVRLEHDFDPAEGEMPLREFVDQVRALLDAEGEPVGPPRPGGGPSS